MPSEHDKDAKPPRRASQVSTGTNDSAGDTPHSPAAAASGAPPIDLSQQSREFLIQRVQALERQLMIRNKDCARLLQDRQALAAANQRCEEQKEVILALKEELAVARTERDSAREYVERMRQLSKDEEHDDLRRRLAASAGQGGGAGVVGSTIVTPPRPDGRRSSIKVVGVHPYEPGSASGAKASPAPAPGGTVVQTSAGPQVLYNSSDISSLGFQPKGGVPRPYDFLGGPGAQQELLDKGRAGAGHGGQQDTSEEAQVRRLMQMTMEEAQMDKKYAELGDLEEQQLQNRLNALRRTGK